MQFNTLLQLCQEKVIVKCGHIQILTHYVVECSNLVFKSMAERLNRETRRKAPVVEPEGERLNSRNNLYATTKCRFVPFSTPQTPLIFQFLSHKNGKGIKTVLKFSKFFFLITPIANFCILHSGGASAKSSLSYPCAERYALIFSEQAVLRGGRSNYCRTYSTLKKNVFKSVTQNYSKNNMVGANDITISLKYFFFLFINEPSSCYYIVGITP